jgi:phage portal protein BeeE
VKLLEPLVKREERASLGDYLSWLTTITTGGHTYTLPVQTTMPGEKAEPISDSLVGYATGGLQSNGVVFGLERVRVNLFAQARFQYQRMRGGRPTELFGDPSLNVLERPWPGGVTADLLALMLLDADLAGNAYYKRYGNQIARWRPDWVEVILGERIGGTGPLEKVGYLYYHGGKHTGADPVMALASEVAHFMPMPDPLYNYRGMSWITPVVREIQADQAATSHKLKFFENAATPNLAVSLPKEIDPDQFEQFVDKMDAAHSGFENAYKTLYTGGGADVTVIGADMKQLDFKVTQGAGETRIALAAGIHPTVAGLAEGLQGSSLNAGNFGQARRQVGDITLAHLWGNVAASLETIVPPPAGARLTVDKRDIPFLMEDRKDAAEIQQIRAQSIRQLVDAGYKPDSVVAAVENEDMTLLVHSNLFSVQLQAPTTGQPPVDAAPDDATA